MSFVSKFVENLSGIGIEMQNAWNYRPSYKGFGGGYNSSKVWRGMKNLEQRGIIIQSDDRFKFTKNGRSWFQKSLLKYHRFKGTVWDKKWRVVIFDIPQEFHKQRNYFRTKLKAMGFYMLQKSVFVIPYPCEEELGVICHQFKITDYIDLILADSVGFKEEEVKKVFGIVA